METLRKMKKRLTTEEVYYKLNWYLTPIKGAPSGGGGTNLDNRRLPAGQWFKATTRQSGETAYVFMADREALAAKGSKSVLLRDVVLQYPGGERQNVSPHAALHWIIYT